MPTEKITDAAGIPSYMVKIPKFNVSDVIPGGRNEPHPAFIVKGEEIPAIYISKYQNVVINGRAYSLPYQKPEVSINFDRAREVCEAKGAGFHLMTNAEWAAVALWSKAHGTMPHGNNNCGSDYRDKQEKGICFDGHKILTGSGPNTFSHDGTEDGIFDLNGNVWEWVGGLRLMDGEIQVIPDNDAAAHVSQTTKSRAWKPFHVGDKTVKISVKGGEIEFGTEITGTGWDGFRFADLKASIEIPDALKELALFPADDENLTEYFWADTDGENVPIRGGGWGDGSDAGVFDLDLNNPRSDVYTNIGFRSAYVEI